MTNEEMQASVDRTHAFMSKELRDDATSAHAQTLLMVMILAHAERQTALLERIAAALAPDGASQPEKNDTPYAPAHERGV